MTHRGQAICVLSDTEADIADKYPFGRVQSRTAMVGQMLHLRAAAIADACRALPVYWVRVSGIADQSQKNRSRLMADKPIRSCPNLRHFRRKTAKQKGTYLPPAASAA
jgi:hypothetical protein